MVLLHFYLILGWHMSEKKGNNTKDVGKKIGKEAFDWLKALIYAVVAVLIINLFVLENMMVPTTSMVPTIMPGDRLFVEKITYQSREPEYGDIFAFWTPFVDKIAQEKLQAFDHFMNMFYPAEYQGHVKYVKRLIGKPGDIIEMELNSDLNGYHILVNGETPEQLEDLKYEKAGIFNDPDFYLKLAYPDKYKVIIGNQINWFKYYNESLEYDKAYENMVGDVPRNEYAWYDEESKRIKIKIPEGMYFAMGDNTNESFDCRYFGFVPEKNIVGRPIIRFWPLNRFGIPK